MRNKKVNRKRKINVIKILGLLFKIILVFLMFYVVIDRVQDINGLSFFFTTWN